MDFCLELAWICSKNLSCTLASDTEEPRRGHSTSLLRQSNEPGRLAGRVNDREPGLSLHPANMGNFKPVPLGGACGGGGAGTSRRKHAGGGYRCVPENV